MAKYTGPSCRQCRREGVKMFLKGDRCFTDKCAIVRRSTIPGQHGSARRGMMKEYGLSFVKNRKQRDIMAFLKSSSETTLQRQMHKRV